jgi:membrane protease subunit HflK
VLGSSNKVIMDEKGGSQGVIPYLPLPEIQNRSKTNATTTNSTTTSSTTGGAQ